MNIPICDHLDNDIRADWVAALRSDHYLQGSEALKTEYGDGHGNYGMYFCCLGVLIDTMPINKWATEPDSDNFYLSNLCHDTAYIFDGYASGWGLSLPEQKVLASMNDAGVPFSAIADMIESSSISFNEGGHVIDKNGVVYEGAKYDVLSEIHDEIYNSNMEGE